MQLKGQISSSSVVFTNSLITCISEKKKIKAQQSISTNQECTST
uniref:Uncharacterized protein n=1 Tax=Arundo donax TaxID=35708 RepID=A0A0A9BC25_ARUDO